METIKKWMTEIKESENRFGTHNPRADRVVNCVCEIDVKASRTEEQLKQSFLLNNMNL